MGYKARMIRTSHFFYWVWKYADQQRHHTKPCSCLASFCLRDVPSYSPLLFKTEITDTCHSSSTYHTRKRTTLTWIENQKKKKKNQLLNINFFVLKFCALSEVSFTTAQTTSQTEYSTGKLSPSHPSSTEASRTHNIITAEQRVYSGNTGY